MIMGYDANELNEWIRNILSNSEGHETLPRASAQDLAESDCRTDSDASS